MGFEAVTDGAVCFWSIEKAKSSRPREVEAAAAAGPALAGWLALAASFLWLRVLAHFSMSLAIFLAVLTLSFLSSFFLSGSSSAALPLEPRSSDG